MKSATMKNGKEGEKMKMFTKEKLERWIKILKNLELYSQYEVEVVEEIIHTLEQIYTSMTSDNSI